MAHAEKDRLILQKESAIYCPKSQTEWSLEQFAEKLRISIKATDDGGLTMEFDIIGIDPPIVNAFRRILLGEVPTMAVDKVFLYNNTSVIYDEVLTHRIGLIPIIVDPREFNYRPKGDKEGSPDNTIEFELKVKCTKIPPQPKDTRLRDRELYKHEKVFSNDMKFIPKENQLRKFGPIRPVEDILIAKLGPGQEIDLKAHCVKGIGKDHAKFSPVATVSYRLLPEITFHKEITGQLAHRLSRCFSEGVIDVVKEDGREVARLVDVRKEACSRNVFCDDKLRDLVTLKRVTNHFIFTIESTGALSAEELFLESIGVLKKKCQYFLGELAKLTAEAKKK